MDRGPALLLQPARLAGDLDLGVSMDKWGSPDRGGSLDTSAAALAPRGPAPLAPPLATLTDSASAGSGSPGDTSTSLQHHFQVRQQSGRAGQQRKGAALPKSPTPSGDASARGSKRKADQEAARPARGRGPNAPDSDGEQRLGSAHALGLALHGQQHGGPGPTPPGFGWPGVGNGAYGAAMQHGPVLELPGFGDLDDVPGLDDLLSGLADEDPFLGDPFAPGPAALASPWQADDPFAAAAAPPAPAPPKPSAQQPSPLNPFGMHAAAPAPLLVPQPLMDRAASADTRRSMTSLEQLPGPAAPPLPPASGSKSSGAKAATALQPAAARSRVRLVAHQEGAAAAAGAPCALPGSEPRAAGVSGKGLGDQLGGGSLGAPAGSEAPVGAPPPPSPPQPPSVQWLSRDASRGQPVKRAASAGKPPRPPADASQRSLSAGAALVARAAAAPPCTRAARGLQGGADLGLLQCVFGAHFPERWRW